MRSAIILNSTQTYEHLGCYLTMAGLKSMLQEAGIKTVYEIGTNESAIDVAPAFFSLNPDALIVINGEGSLYQLRQTSLDRLFHITCYLSNVLNRQCSTRSSGVSYLPNHFENTTLPAPVTCPSVRSTFPRRF